MFWTLVLVIIMAWLHPSYAQAPNADTSQDGYRAIERGDYLGALYFWRPCADAGDAEAQFMMGWFAQYGLDIEQNYAEALRWYQKSADQNFALEQTNIGVMYDVGMGVGQDQSQAAHWYEKAVAQGNGPAQFNLGILYDDSKGVSRDIIHAYVWLSLAASTLTGDGQVAAARARDDVGKRMSQQQMAQV